MNVPPFAGTARIVTVVPLGNQYPPGTGSVLPSPTAETCSSAVGVDGALHASPASPSTKAIVPERHTLIFSFPSRLSAIRGQRVARGPPRREHAPERTREHLPGESA
jgi:hypothetical protein